jgi:cbb3-type cytochrome oxidase subunit 3
VSVEWVALYKLGRLALLAIALVAICAWVFARSRKERLEEPARRMLEEDDA